MSDTPYPVRIVKDDVLEFYICHRTTNVAALAGEKMNRKREHVWFGTVKFKSLDSVPDAIFAIKTGGSSRRQWSSVTRDMNDLREFSFTVVDVEDL